MCTLLTAILAFLINQTICISYSLASQANVAISDYSKMDLTNDGQSLFMITPNNNIVTYFVMNPLSKIFQIFQRRNVINDVLGSVQSISVTKNGQKLIVSNSTKIQILSKNSNNQFQLLPNRTLVLDQSTSKFSTVSRNGKLICVFSDQTVEAQLYFFNESVGEYFNLTVIPQASVTYSRNIIGNNDCQISSNNEYIVFGGNATTQQMLIFQYSQINNTVALFQHQDMSAYTNSTIYNFQFTQFALKILIQTSEQFIVFNRNTTLDRFSHFQNIQKCSAYSEQGYQKGVINDDGNTLFLYCQTQGKIILYHLNSTSNKYQAQAEKIEQAIKSIQISAYSNYLITQNFVEQKIKVFSLNCTLSFSATCLACSINACTCNISNQKFFNQTSEQCISCYIRCKTCNGSTSSDCLSCQDNYTLQSDNQCTVPQQNNTTIIIGLSIGIGIAFVIVVITVLLICKFYFKSRPNGENYVQQNVVMPDSIIQINNNLDKSCPAPRSRLGMSKISRLKLQKKADKIKDIPITLMRL